MKKLRWKIISLAILSLLVFGCAETSRLVGDIAAQQAYQSTYNNAYKKAKAQGQSEQAAREYASRSAERASTQKKQVFEGVSDVFTSVSDIPYSEERKIGETLALEGLQRYGMPVDDLNIQKYVNLVGNALGQNSDRPDIPYRFVVVESPIYNAFSCPGGIIFVTSELVKSMNNESELAGVLAHEIAHVTHKHALQSLKKAKFFEGGAKIATANMKGEKGMQYQQMIGDLQNILFDKGLDKSMEFEADRTGMEIAYKTGYNPEGLINVLRMLQQKQGTSQESGSWYSTHPPLNTRISNTQGQLRQYPDYNRMATVENRFQHYVQFIP
jgi:predicted Zn-dependent protease